MFGLPFVWPGETRLANQRASLLSVQLSTNDVFDFLTSPVNHSLVELRSQFNVVHVVSGQFVAAVCLSSSLPATRRRCREGRWSCASTGGGGGGQSAHLGAVSGACPGRDCRKTSTASLLLTPSFSLLSPPWASTSRLSIGAAINLPACLVVVAAVGWLSLGKAA